MTNTQPNLLQLAKQGDTKAIAALMNRSLQPKNITAKAAFKDGCLQIMLESNQVPNQQALVKFIRNGIIGLETSLIERVNIYGKCLGDEFPAWNQELELAGKVKNDNIFTFDENNVNKNQLQTNFAQDVLDQFMNLKARTSIGISYNDLPPVLGTAKLAVQKFERSPDSKVCPYLTELINKVMHYYEISLECLSLKVKRSSIDGAFLIGFGTLTGIALNEPIGKFIASEFPNVPTKPISIASTSYDFDTVLSVLWIKAGELTDELDEILNKPVDLETLKLKKLEITTQSSTYSQNPAYSTPTPTKTNSAGGIRNFHVTGAYKKIPAGILAILVGTSGIHKFILGYTTEGIIMLLLSLFTFGYGAIIIAIISIIEGIIYLTKSDQDFIKTYITNKKGWF